MKKPTLGWLRVLFALSVIDTHLGFYKHFFDRFLAPFFIDIFKKPIFYFVGDGHLAVYGFFMLSGYLVASISKKYQNPSFKALLHFTFTRYMRIYPLYLVLFAVFFTILKPHANATYFFYNSLIPYGIIAFFDKEKPLLFASLLIPQAWTLCYDVVFYPIGFVVSFYKKYFYPFFISFLILFLIAISKKDIPFALFSNANFFHLYFYSLIDFCFLAFIIGIFLYHMKSHIPKSKKLFIFSMLLYIYICYLPFFLNPFLGYIFGLIALSYIIFYLGENGKGPIENFLGNFTYSLYLLHYPIYIYFVHNPYKVLFISLILAFLVAVSVENLFERIRHLILKYHPYPYKDLKYVAVLFSFAVFLSALFYIPFVHLWYAKYSSKPRLISYYQDHWIGLLAQFSTFKKPISISIPPQTLPIKGVCIHVYPKNIEFCPSIHSSFSMTLNP
ncbi:MAG: hypothetical protein C0170_00495, partial [Hydrogenobaculum sp.]